MEANMFNKRSFVTGTAAITFVFQVVGCGAETPITLEPTPINSVKLEPVWEITGDPNPLNKPVGVTVDQDGNIYVMDTENSRVQKFDSNGQFVLMWGSQGSEEGQFQNASPQGWLGHIAVDTQGDIYVIDVNNFRIQKFDGSGSFQIQWGAEGTGDGEFRFIPFDITVDMQDNIYVCESASAHRVQKFDANGKFLLAWGKTGDTDGEFSTGDTCTVASDPAGNILVADNSGRIQKFDANGQFLSKITLPPVNNAFVSIWNMDVDNQGNIYVGDATHAQIIKLDSDGRILAIWELGEAASNDLQDIAVDAEGNIYISDTLNNIVKKFQQP